MDGEERRRLGGGIIRLGECYQTNQDRPAVTRAVKVGVPPNGDKDNARHGSKAFISPLSPASAATVACTFWNTRQFHPRPFGKSLEELSLDFSHSEMFC